MAFQINLARVMRHVIGEDIGRGRAFPAPALKRIESAIADQEQRHAGEVRFAVEGGLSPARVLSGMTPRQRAEELFAQLRVWDTEHNNGVLIYLLLADHAVEVVADRGIHAKVGDEAWQTICEAMQPLLRDGRYEEGVLTGLSLAGQLLERHFPTAGGRGNELPDTPIVL